MTKQARLNALINRISGKISSLATDDYDHYKNRLNTLINLYFKARRLQKRIGIFKINY